MLHNRVSRETRYSIYIKQFQYLLIQFQESIHYLEKKTDENNKSFDCNYICIAQIAEYLINCLNTAAEVFFTDKITPEVYQGFSLLCDQLLKNATQEFEKPRRHQILSKVTKALGLPAPNNALQKLKFFKEKIEESKAILKISMNFPKC